MRAEWTRYAVPAWGVGELWTNDGVVLAHEFAFQRVSDTVQPVSDTGAATVFGSSLTGTPDEVGSHTQIASFTAGSACGAKDAVKTQFPLDRKPCLTPTELAERLRAFLGGDDVSLADIPLDLDWTTPFQRAIADALRLLPRGEIVSYGELAALAGYPGAARAVGSFCATNRFMFLIPCHRVVGASGIGGYGSAGVGVKRRLLALEGVCL